MKYILTIICWLIAYIGFCQYPVKQGIGNKSNTIVEANAIKVTDGIINGSFIDTAAANLTHIKDYPHAQIMTGNIQWLRDSTATKWLQLGPFIRGTAITSLPQIGYAPNTNNISQWIDSVFYQSQPPLATLTGGGVQELQTPQTLVKTYNYTAGRQFATSPLSTIIIAGVNKSFTQPALGSSVSGSGTVEIAANTDTTISNVVTTIDGKTTTATTTFSFLPKRYFGWITDTTGIGTAGFNDSKITSLGNELSILKVKSWSTGNPTGTQFYVYAYYSTAGELSHFDMNGFPSIDAMNHVTRNFTNALGYTGQWIIYWSKNGQTLSSTVVAN